MRIISIIIIACAVIFAAIFFSHSMISRRAVTVGWKEDFSGTGGSSLPEGWKLVRKPGTRSAVFLVKRDTKENISFLHMEADKASASVITRITDVNITKTPFLRWRWRVASLPKGADGRVKAKDDQAIGIYVGTGNVLNNKSISYRWDTETPKGDSGNCAYGLGRIKVKWYTLRNKEDARGGQWFIEERNVAEDFKKAWGFYPEKIYLSISCNSQYTDSQAAADLNWIEFISVE